MADTQPDSVPRPAPVSNPVGTEPTEPASIHRRTSPRSSRNSDDLDHDNLELHQIETHHHDDYDSSLSISSGDIHITTHQTVSRTSQAPQRQRDGILGRIQRFWTSHVVLTVAQKKNRDYFALERTFLAYIRTSVMLAMQGVLIAQLFRLQGAHAEKGLGYHDVGVPLSVTCHSAAILTAVLGAHRFWKQQSAIALGTVYTGGWELNLIGFLTTAITLVTFILSILIAVTIS